jgi:amidase
MGKELWQESAATLAYKIRTGATTSRDVIEAHLERIELVNVQVNAVVEVRADDVRREADAADASRVTPRAKAPSR